MMKNAKRFLSMLLALSMVFGLLVFPTSAAETHTHEHSEEAKTVSTKSEIKVEDSFSIVPLLTEGVEVDEEDPAIIAVTKELDNMMVLNAEGDPVPLTEEQKLQIIGMFQQYLDQWEANAHLLGVQVPFFLQYNDNGEDGLGILGEMLAMAGASVDAVRAGYMTFDDLSGMIMNFYYGDQLGLQYYGKDIASSRDEVLELINNSGAVTDVQKLLVLNDWLAHNVTFDMPYIMNSGKEEDKKPMVAADPQPHEHYQDVYDVMYGVYESQIRETFKSNIINGLKAQMKIEFYKAAIEQGYYNAVLEAATAQAVEQALPAVTDAVHQQVYGEAYKAAEEAIEKQIYDAASADYVAKNHTHDYNADFTWTQAEDGTWTATATVTCAEGEEVYENLIATVVKTEASTAPNCTEAGEDVYMASVEVEDANGIKETIDDINRVSVAALGHDWNDDGVCTVCGETSENHTHDYAAEYTWTQAEDGEYSATVTAVCNTCGDKHENVAAERITKDDDSVAPTCTEKGTDILTAEFILNDDNGSTIASLTDTKIVELEALGHTEVAIGEAKEATCTEAGITAGVKCSVCDAVITAQEIIPATGHKEETVEGKAATCTETGLTDGIVCEVCETVITAQEEIEALGHDFSEETGKCTRCEEVDPDFVAHEHDYVESVTKEGNCAYDGEKVITCSGCDYTETVVIPATGNHVDNRADDVCDVCGLDMPKEDEDNSEDIGANSKQEAPVLEVSEEVAKAADEYAKDAVEAAAEDIAKQADAVATEEADKYVEENAEAIKEMAADAVANDADAQAQLKAAAESETEKFLTENAEAINADPVAFCETAFGAEAAAEIAAGWDATWADWEANGIPGMVSMFAGEIWPKVIEQFYIQGMTQQGMTEEQAAAQAAQIMEADADAIAADPYAYCVEKFGQEGADQAQAVVNDQLKQMGIDGSTETNPEGRVSLDIIVALQMDTPQQDPMLQKPDGSYMTPNEAVPVFADQAALGLTDGVLNYWQGSHFGALGRGTAVCLGYTKAFTYLVQYMNPAIYGVNGANTDMSKAANWKTADQLYYDAEGNLDINANYVVDDVRITFDANVTMYGETQENFNSDHFWNAVKIDGKWYYADPCYTDVYTEVMMRDRVETDGSMNHMYFIFSHSTATELYSGNYSEIKTLYADVSTHTDFEDSWISRIKSNTYFDGGYAYYLYDSTDLITLMQDANSENNNNADLMDQEYQYKIVRHKLSNKDNGSDGDTNYEALIEFNYKADEDDEESIARVYDGSKMVENVLLTELFAQHEAEREIYPSIALTAALYNGKIYFNISNVIASYDLKTYEVEIVKEYNTVYGLRDDTNPFGGMAFSVSNSSNYDFAIENHPIAAMTIKPDGNMYVSIATNFAFISGKDPHNSEDQSSFGYEFEESNYNAAYNSYQNDRYDDSMYEQFGYEKETNDNDEFMWSANFVETLQMSHLAGTGHSYKEVSVPAFCGRNAYTENRCSTCGASEPGSRVEVEDSALAGHHFVEFVETYYTKTNGSSGNWNTGRVYVCTVCGFHIDEPTEPDPNANYDMMGTTYEEQKAIYDEQKAIYDEAVATAGHTYEPTDAVWAEDYSTVTFSILECSNVCPERKATLDCLLEDDTIKLTLAEKVVAETTVIDTIGTCPEGLIAIYQAEGEVEVEIIKDKPETFAYCFTKEVQHAAKDCDFSTGIGPVCGDSNVKRIYGDGRVETAIEAAEALKAALKVDSFDTIILANGDKFADALAGSYLATVKDAPILLHRDIGAGDELNEAYILANLTKGGTVYVLGGTIAIPEETIAGLVEAGIKVTRLQGEDRFMTNLAILEEAGVSNEEILIATGWEFADCLSASAAGKPILMVNTNKNVLSEAHVAFLTKHAANNFTIVGGPVAVSEELEAAIDEIVTGEIVRLAGSTREETSVLVAERFFEAPEFVVLAFSRNFPDGLCGGPLAYAMKAPLLLVNQGKEDAAADYIAENAIKAGYIMGGPAVVAEDTAKVCFGITSELEIPAL